MGYGNPLNDDGEYFHPMNKIVHWGTCKITPCIFKYLLQLLYSIIAMLLCAAIQVVQNSSGRCAWFKQRQKKLHQLAVDKVHFDNKAPWCDYLKWSTSEAAVFVGTHSVQIWKEACCYGIRLPVLHTQQGEALSESSLGEMWASKIVLNVNNVSVEIFKKRKGSKLCISRVVRRCW